MKKISTIVTTKRKSKDSRQSAPFQCNSYNVQSLKLLLFPCYCYQPYRHWAAFLGRYVEWNQALAADDIGDPITMLSNLQIQYYVNRYTKKSLSFHKFWWSEPLPENLKIFAVTIPAVVGMDSQILVCFLKILLQSSPVLSEIFYLQPTL